MYELFLIAMLTHELTNIGGPDPAADGLTQASVQEQAAELARLSQHGSLARVVWASIALGRTVAPEVIAAADGLDSQVYVGSWCVSSTPLSSTPYRTVDVLTAPTFEGEWGARMVLETQLREQLTAIAEGDTMTRIALESAITANRGALDVIEGILEPEDGVPAEPSPGTTPLNEEKLSLDTDETTPTQPPFDVEAAEAAKAALLAQWDDRIRGYEAEAARIPATATGDDAHYRENLQASAEWARHEKVKLEGTPAAELRPATDPTLRVYSTATVQAVLAKMRNGQWGRDQAAA
jgi:hypothetical protein